MSELERLLDEVEEAAHHASEGGIAAVPGESGLTGRAGKGFWQERQKPFRPVSTRKALSNQSALLSFLPAVVLLAGCSSIPREELAWQAAHIVDIAQTVQIARSECFREDDPVTSRLIGEHPSVGEAVAWGVAWSGLHLGVTRMLEAWEAPGWVQGTWQALTIGNSAYIVKQNFDQGIDPWGTDCHRARDAR